jgi:peptide chain release factor 3
MSQRRELLDTAFAGDIIGIPNHGVLQLGDTLTEGEALQFTGLPFFAPEMFRAVGQLQFEVVAHRLEHEYGVKARIMGSHFNLARWVTSDDANELKKFMDANAHRVALDAVDAPTLLVDHSATLRAVEQQWPKIKFHALREHAGLVFQSKM